MPVYSYFIVEETVESRNRSWLAAVAALCLVQFVDVLGVTVVVTALPAILAGLRASATAAAPVITAYSMFFGGLLMLAARLGDRYGHRRVLLLGLGGFAATSLLAATAASVPALVAARCLQGAAAALSVPSALRLLLVAAGDQDGRRRALAGWSAAGAAAGGSGFLLGGALTDLAGWRTVFWINLPLAALLAMVVIAVAPRPRPQWTGRLDAAGAAALTAAVMAAVAGASLLQRAGERALGLLVLCGAAALAGLVVIIERRAQQPLLPAAAMRHPRLRRGAVAAALNTATTSSAMTLATIYLQDVRGVSPAAAGLLLVPFSLCVIAGSSAAAPLLRRRSASVGIALGLATIAAGVGTLLALPSPLGSCRALLPSPEPAWACPRWRPTRSAPMCPPISRPPRPGSSTPPHNSAPHWASRSCCWSRRRPTAAAFR